MVKWNFCYIIQDIKHTAVQMFTHSLNPAEKLNWHRWPVPSTCNLSPISPAPPLIVRVTWLGEVRVNRAGHYVCTMM